MKLLVTGFEPFGEHGYNPSMMAVEELKTSFSDDRLVFRILPVIDEAYRIYHNMLLEIQPDMIINTGLNQNTPNILLEKTALNIVDYKGQRDNNGKTISFCRIFSDYPDAFISDIETGPLLRMLLSAHIPAVCSYHAGTFICNMVYYTSFTYFLQLKRAYNCLFIHIPFDSEHVSELLDKKPVNISHIPKNKIIEAFSIIINHLIRL